MPDDPDATVWCDEEGKYHYGCRHCPLTASSSRSFYAAWNGATYHLWATHSLRRVWVYYGSWANVDAVQLALPHALAMKHRPRDRT